MVLVFLDGVLIVKWNILRSGLSRVYRIQIDVSVSQVGDQIYSLCV